MTFFYLALIQGGIGPDVWDKEKRISGVDFKDAATKAQAVAEEMGGQVASLQQDDYDESRTIQSQLTLALKDTIKPVPASNADSLGWFCDFDFLVSLQTEVNEDDNSQASLEAIDTVINLLANRGYCKRDSAISAEKKEGE